MTSSLSVDEVDALLPLLDYVAALVRDHGTVNRDELDILLLGAGVGGSQAIDELLLWATILARARGSQDPLRRETVQRALMLRRIPEAQALLALSTAAGPSTVQPLSASVQSIHLGPLSAKQGACAQFMVKGGPGRIVSGSDAIRVEPEVFDASETSITIRIDGLAAGMLISSIALVSSRERLEIPVTAEWVSGTGTDLDRAPPIEGAPWPKPPSVPAGRIEPVLERIVQSITSHTFLSYDAIEELLRGLDVPAGPHVVGAVKQWADILQGIRDAPDHSDVPQAIAELVARGIPKESAERTVIEITGASEQKIPTSSLPPARHPSPIGRLVVALDGSGTHTTLADALRDAAPDATIQIQPGDHHLSTGVHILEPVTIEGASRETTRLILDKGQFALRFSASGLFALRNIGFERASKRGAANLVIVEDGEVAIADCAFRGGRSSSQITGAGLIVMGAASGRVVASHAEDNVFGFLFIGDSSVGLSGCAAIHNEGSGIIFAGYYEGEARDNMCEANKFNGIEVDGDAKPTLQGNTCKDNKENGIAFFHSSGGEAGENVCEANKDSGIQVSDDAQPTLQGNTCTRNESSGIDFSERSGGEAGENVCEANKLHGIQVSEDATPTLQGNTCTRNEGTGILVLDHAAPLLESNTCDRNLNSGIEYPDTAGGIVRDNQCRLNKYYGIHIAITAVPTVQGNRCANNGVFDIRDVRPDDAQSQDSVSDIRDVRPDDAQLQERSSPAVPPQLNFMVVAVDGTGTHTSLPDALKDAAPGATIQLKAGRHSLSQEITIVRPVTIEGQSRKSTKLVSDGDGPVILYRGDGLFVLQNLRVERTATWVSSDVVLVETGQVDVNGCYFRGGIADADTAGAGLAVLGTVSGTITNCVAEVNACGFYIGDHASMAVESCTGTSNTQHGIRVDGHASANLSDNRYHANGGSGIAYGGQSTGKGSNNTCTQNENDGIAITDVVKLQLDRNTCTRNEFNGIAFSGSSAGEARDNVCEANKFHGIQVIENATPTLQSNTCSRNEQNGIALFGSSAGQARDNVCKENKNDGIGVIENATPTVQRNTCAHNESNGITFSGSSSGVARLNICSANQNDGIHIESEADFFLQNNTCRNNRWNGITFWHTARGEARENQCEGNWRCGIYVDENSTALLTNNLLRNNHVDVVDARILVQEEPSVQEEPPAQEESVPKWSIDVLPSDDIDAALLSAADGATIRLAPGVHRLTGPLKCAKSLTLTGAGSYHTELIAAPQRPGIECVGQHSWTLEGFALKCDSGVTGITVSDGTITILNCKFTRMEVESPVTEDYEDKDVNWLAHGVTVLCTGKSTGKIHGCHLHGGALGIWVTEEAHIDLSENSIEGSVAAIRYDMDARGEVRKNRCDSCQVGIFLRGRCTPALYHNSCSRNVDGIAVGGSSTSALHGNECVLNEKAGICYFEAAAGLARENKCTTSMHGIFVGYDAAPVLERNTCEDNREFGIFFVMSGGGAARENICRTNHSGIVIIKPAHPSLESNICESNRRYNIVDWRTRRGWFRGR